MCVCVCTREGSSFSRGGAARRKRYNLFGRNSRALLPRADDSLDTCSEEVVARALYMYICIGVGAVQAWRNFLGESGEGQKILVQ